MRLVDMTHPLDGSTPVAPILPSASFERVMEVGRDVANVTMCRFPSHCGTHLDAPLHFFPDGRTIDQIPLEWLCGTASLIDAPADVEQEITADALEASGVTVRPGDRLFIKTGFSDRYHDDDYVRHPYLAESAAAWILERRVRAVAIDLLTPDAPHSVRDESFSFPIHHALLGDDVMIVENVFFPDGLPERFDVDILPLPLTNGDGAPVRIAARLP